MKIFATVLALCIIGYASAAQGTCVTSSYCMGCVDDAATCNACFNWGKGGTVGARQLASNACSTAVANAVTDCKIYNGTITSTKTKYDCMECNSKSFLNVTDNATAANIAITCSDTAISTTTCTGTVSNCTQTFCYKNQSGTYSTGCYMCKSGYMGTGTLTLGYASCTSTGIITNCDVGSPGGNTYCAYCKSDYAVANNSQSCTSFTTDSNCRKLGGGSWCGECWHSYYFNAGKCVLKSNLMMIGTFVVALLMWLN